GRALPTTIPQYLAQLRVALEGADPAMVQDALYDAEEYLRSGRALPTTIPQYLAQLRVALEGADPAMVQDALY
ncbi:hypothetical protein C7E17_26745, partial [Stenotrophomonas maltophilia]